MKKIYTLLFLICTTMVIAFKAKAQCSTAIATFPYTEDFEATNGGWFSGGNNSDWAWGKPQKPVISSAASGDKAWVVGGLTGSSYANSESSWLQSPCFDLSSLSYPQIKFNVFWETETGYDGASFQYSLDFGVTWKDAGTVNDGTSCLNVNWFNADFIKFLGGLTDNSNGWSGNAQLSSGSCKGGGGSRTWLPASKCLPQLAGKKNVLFRFVFGAGTTCNAYDGFAIDDFSIAETPPNKADFTSACSGNNTVSFTNTSDLCPSNFKWDFGDPGSIAKNNSFDQNPTHVFSSGGVFTVTLTVSSPNNAPSTIQHQVTILNVSTTILTPVKCSGDNNGAIEATVTGGTGPYFYSWDTNPVQTSATATNLFPGTYTITVSGTNACPAALATPLERPAPLLHAITSVNPGCVAPKGSINIIETGGTAPYTYSWSPNVSTTSSASGLDAGTYTITVMDKFFCKDIFSVDIVDVIPPKATIDNKTDVSCNGGNNGTATASVSGGIDPVTYSWDTSPEQTTLSAENLKPGNYTFTATDANGCKGTAAVNITEPPATTVSVATTNATCNLSNGSINLFPSGGALNYEYIWIPAISTTATAANIKAGKYGVTLKDMAGCITIVPDIRIPNIGTATKIFLGKDSTICIGEKVVLDPAVSGNFLWQDNSTNPTFTVDQTGKYFVRFTNADNCVSSDTILIDVVTNCTDIYFPTIFSPNDDGLNDQFGPVGNLNAVTNYSLSVYNRWGQLVFISTDPRKRWTGQSNAALSAPSTYTWFASYNFKGSGHKFKKGVLVIVR